jgi:hypothetical protein
VIAGNKSTGGPVLQSREKGIAWNVSWVAFDQIAVVF